MFSIITKQYTPEDISLYKRIIKSLEKNTLSAFVLLIKKDYLDMQTGMQKQGIKSFLEELFPDSKKCSLAYCQTGVRYVTSIPGVDIDFNGLSVDGYQRMINEHILDIELAFSNHSIHDIEYSKGIAFDRLATTDQSSHQDTLFDKNGAQIPVLVSIGYLECGQDSLCFYHPHNPNEVIGRVQTQEYVSQGLVPFVFFNGDAWHGRDDLGVGSDSRRHMLIKTMYEI